MLIWVGVYNLLDLYTVPATPMRDSIYFVCGILVLLITRTMYAMAFVYPPDDDSLPYPKHDSVWYFHVFSGIRSIISIVGQNMIWLGGWNLLENYMDTSIWQSCFYGAFGLLLFLLTNTFMPNSYMSDGEEEEEEEELFFSGTGNIQGNDEDGEAGDIADQPSVLVSKEQAALINSSSDSTNDAAELSVVFYVKTVLALIGQIVHNTGAWSLFDTYLLPQSIWRDFAILVAGLLLLVVSGTLAQNASITPIITTMWQPDPDDDVQLEDPTSTHHRRSREEDTFGETASLLSGVRRRRPVEPDTRSARSTASYHAKRGRSRYVEPTAEQEAAARAREESDKAIRAARANSRSRSRSPRHQRGGRVVPVDSRSLDYSQSSPIIVRRSSFTANSASGYCTPLRSPSMMPSSPGPLMKDPS